MDKAVSIIDLSLSFTKDNKELHVLDNINLEVAFGETVAVLGPSGCGKTTLLKLVGGLDISASLGGSINVSPSLGEKQHAGANVGFAFQNPVLLNWRTVFDNVCLPLEIIGEKKDIEERVDYALELTGIADFKNAFPSELSGGMKQRVNLARAIVHEPGLLLLDEPLGSLDEISRLKLNYELSNIIRSNGYTTMLITHSLREALILADRIIIFTNRPAKVFMEFAPELDGKREMGFETTEEFNEELKRLSKCFLMVENE